MLLIQESTFLMYLILQLREGMGKWKMHILEQLISTNMIVCIGVCLGYQILGTQYFLIMYAKIYSYKLITCMS